VSDSKEPIRLEYGVQPPAETLSGNGWWRFKPKRVAIILIPIVLAIAIYYPFSPGGVQSRNMAKARAQIPIIKARIVNDPRFAHVEMFDATVNNGILVIDGDVSTQTDLDALKEIVSSTSPPVTIGWRVDVATSTTPTTFKSAEK
jgi:hypothetical protein